MTRKGLLISPELCIGCRACQIACKSWNQLPGDRTINTGSFENPPDLSADLFTKIRFLEIASRKNPLRWIFVSRRCMHCDDAACMRICPVPGALYKTKEGAVVYDKEKCNGCRLCAKVCPFNVPRFDKNNKISKCHFCSDRIANGMSPACAKTCPTGALLYGDRGYLIEKAGKAGYSNVYGQTNLGGLGAMYAFREAPLLYGYEDNPSVNEMIVFWHQYLKPGKWIGSGGIAALKLLDIISDEADKA